MAKKCKKGSKKLYKKSSTKKTKPKSKIKKY